MRTLSILLLIMLQASFAQQKYLIYFTEKIPGNVIAKGSDVYNSALSLLSERCIERRNKTMGADIIKIEDVPVSNVYLDALAVNGIRVINVLNWFNAVSAYLTEDQISYLRAQDFVEKIEPVKTFRCTFPEIKPALMKSNNSDSSLYGNSFLQLEMSGIPPVHSNGITGKGVLLGLLDTGFRWRTLESLSGINVLSEYDFIFGDSVTENQQGDALSQHNHGTSVLSVIGGVKDSVLIGAAYGVQFLLAKTEDIRSERQIEEDNYAAALQWMENYGVDIASSSLGYSDFENFSYSYEDMNGKTTIVTKAAELAFQRGVLTITSAGNEGLQPWFYITAPADGFNTIAVGAVDNQNRVAGFSSRGPTSDGRIKPDVTAQGVSVFVASAVQDGLYGTTSGTSLAAPIVAGAAALLKSAYKHLSNVQMRDIILRTSGNFSSPDNERGYGLISASKAVEFPNLEFSDERFILNKIFLGSDISNVDLFLSTGKNNYEELNGIKDSLKYLYLMPVFTNNQVIKFYFKYTLITGDTIRVPSAGYYKFNYGDMIIEHSEEQDFNYILSNNYPNPFNNYTRIRFFAEQPSEASLEIYDALGRRVKTLLSKNIPEGEYLVSWNGRDDKGFYCSSGVYIYRLTLNDYSVSKKMILLK